MQERIEEILQAYPGFASAGLEVPPEAILQSWTARELELYCGSMGQLWPHGRKRMPGVASARAAAGAKAYDDKESERTGGPRKPAPGCKSATARPPLSMLRPHLKVLGLPDTKEPDRKDLKKAYRTQALRWHPDKNSSDPEAASKFQQALAAYEFLQKLLGL